MVEQLELGGGQLGSAEEERELEKQSQEVFCSVDLRGNQQRRTRVWGGSGL